MNYTALITAGGRPAADDLLYPLTKGAPKALLAIAGKPMIQWILDAVDRIDSIDRVIVIGLDAHSNLKSRKSPVYLTDSGGMLENIEAGTEEAIKTGSSPAKILVIASDIPALSPGALEWVISQIDDSDTDIYYFTILKELMEKAYPGCGRSYLKVDGMELCGGDLIVIDSSIIGGDRGIWKKLIAARKSNLKIARIIGIDILILFLLRRLTFRKFLKTIRKRLKINGKVLFCPFPELGMDVDKPYQHALLEEKLRKPESG